MLSLLSLCVTAALLLPLCCGTTIYPQQDEATPTPDYPDYTFDYDGNTTFSYEMYAVLNPEGKIDAKAGGSDANKDLKPQQETNLDVQAMYQRMHHFLPS